MSEEENCFWCYSTSNLSVDDEGHNVCILCRTCNQKNCDELCLDVNLDPYKYCGGCQLCCLAYCANHWNGEDKCYNCRRP